jgi:hypothetical protein
MRRSSAHLVRSEGTDLAKSIETCQKPRSKNLRRPKSQDAAALSHRASNPWEGEAPAEPLGLAKFGRLSGSAGASPWGDASRQIGQGF